MHELKLPNLGEGIEHGEVARVLVAAGDSVRAQQTVIELETDKALVEVPCDAAGTVAEVRVKQGDTINVGQVILTLNEVAATAGETAAVAQTAAAPALAQPQPAQQKMPEHQEPKPGQPKPEVPEPKRPEPVEPKPESPEPARLQPRRPAREVPEPPWPGPEEPPAPELAQAGAVAPAVGPATRRYARQLGVELHAVHGSGRGGRVTQDDVRDYVRGVMQSTAAPGGSAQMQALQLPDFSQWGEIEEQPLSAVRRATAQSVAQSWRAVSLVTQFDEADITDLEAMRQHFKAEAEQRGVHFTLTVLLLKALVAALKLYPRFNASLDSARATMILKRYYHIGVATDTPRGLLMPVLRDVDHRDVWQLAGELEGLAARAKSGHIVLSELRGASFSLSNQGGIGGAHFTPLVNWPEVAILGIGQARTQPVWEAAGAQFRPRLIIPLALSYDHRANDGADAARFITQLKRSLEDPERLLLGL